MTSFSPKINFSICSKEVSGRDAVTIHKDGQGQPCNNKLAKLKKYADNMDLALIILL